MNLADPQQFEEFARLNRPALLAFVKGFNLGHEASEEVVNDALLNAHRRFAQFRGSSSVKTWVWKIAQNLTRNRWWYEQRRGRDFKLSIDAEVLTGFGTYAEIIPDQAEGTHRQVERAELERIIGQLRSTLKPRYAAILLARIERGLSYEEISVEMGLNVGTVKSRMSRARAELFALLPAEVLD